MNHTHIFYTYDDGGEGEEKGLWRWGEEGDYIPVATLHHQNDSCIKMGIDESNFNVSLIVTDKVTIKTSVHKPQPFWRERRAEAESNRGPSAYQPMTSYR